MFRASVKLRTAWRWGGDTPNEPLFERDGFWGPIGVALALLSLFVSWAFQNLLWALWGSVPFFAWGWWVAIRYMRMGRLPRFIVFTFGIAGILYGAYSLSDHAPRTKTEVTSLYHPVPRATPAPEPGPQPEPKPKPRTPSGLPVAHRTLQGFVRIGAIKINTPRLQVGGNLAITVHMTGYGNGPVHDFVFTPVLLIVDFDHMPLTEKDEYDLSNSITASRETYLNVLRKSIADGKATLDDLPPTGVAYKTVETKLTDRQVTGFTQGTTRFYILIPTEWKDLNGTSGHTNRCLWLQAMASNDIGLEEPVWHSCGS